MRTMVTSNAQGGVCLVVRDQPQGWIVEATTFHGPNRVSCKVITDGKHTLIIGVYLSPSTFEHLQDWEEALTRFR